MKNFFSKLSRSWKTKQVARSPCDCRDFLECCPKRPSDEAIRNVVTERHFGGAPEPESQFEKDRRDHIVQSTLFDLKYRCGGEGRCTQCEGKVACRYPSCFQMRPVTKGAEIQVERAAYEVSNAPTREIQALVALAKEEKLPQVIQGIQDLVSSLIKTALGDRPMDPDLYVDGEPGHEHSTGSVKFGQNGSSALCNPLRETEWLREEVTALYLWRAALLVNIHKDEQAVNSLLNLASALEKKDRTRLYSAAAGWAALNDMEIIYYRSLLQTCEPFDLANHYAHERPLLLARVFESLQDDDYFTQLCTHIVFAKEVTATVSRAQAAQIRGDMSEDPMKSYVIPFAIPYYRFCVSKAFWDYFFNLLTMPPVPPPTKEEMAKQAADPIQELNLTPNYVLDALGRSLLLHHLVIFADTREKEIDSGVVADHVEKAKKLEMEVNPVDYDRVLERQQMGLAIARMKELMMTVKSYEMQEKNASLQGDRKDETNRLNSN